VDQVLLIVGIVAAFFLFRAKPVWGITVLMLFATRNFYLVEMTELPKLSLGGRLDLQMYDLALLLLLILTGIRYYKTPTVFYFGKTFALLE
jgi:hypothetical protein